MNGGGRKYMPSRKARQEVLLRLGHVVLPEPIFLYTKYSIVPLPLCGYYVALCMTVLSAESLFIASDASKTQVCSWFQLWLVMSTTIHLFTHSREWGCREVVKSVAVATAQRVEPLETIYYDHIRSR